MCIWMYREFKQRFWGKIVWNFILKQIPVSEKIAPTVKLTCVDEINIGSGWYNVQIDPLKVNNVQDTKVCSIEIADD